MKNRRNVTFREKPTHKLAECKPRRARKYGHPLRRASQAQIVICERNKKNALHSYENNKMCTLSINFFSILTSRIFISVLRFLFIPLRIALGALI